MSEVLQNIGITLKKFIFKHKYFLISFIVLAIIGRIFGREIDIPISSLFYNEDGFFLRNSIFAEVIQYGVHFFMAIFLSIIVLMFIYTLITKKSLFKINRKAFLFIIVTFILAPGLVANLLLKENVGRPRPVSITEFAGDKIFQPPFKISNECSSNCSFVSGHSASMFTLMLFGFFFRGRTRKIVFSATFLIGVITSIGRIIQGRHFFTDTVFAFFFVWLTINLVYEFMYKSDDLPESLK